MGRHTVREVRRSLNGRDDPKRLVDEGPKKNDAKTPRDGSFYVRKACLSRISDLRRLSAYQKSGKLRKADEGPKQGGMGRVDVWIRPDLQDSRG